MKYITIPKSSNIERIIENSRVFDFEIAEDDMKILVSGKGQCVKCQQD